MAARQGVCAPCVCRPEFFPSMRSWFVPNILIVELFPLRNQFVAREDFSQFFPVKDFALDKLFEADEIFSAPGFERDGHELSLIHISEPTRQAEISYAVFCLKKKKKNK